MKLNKIERLKAELSPFGYRQKLNSLDFSKLDEADRFYLKNYGIYNNKLRPESFMLRVRVAGGRMEAQQLLEIVETARAENLEVVLTARAQLELHGLHAENVLAVWKQLLEAGVTTLQTLTDNFRNIVTDPYDGLLPSSHIEGYPLIAQIQATVLDNPEWMGTLPRKFNTAICGSETTHTHFYGNDLYFALAQKEGIWGFNLYLGGKNSESAQAADIFVLPQQVPEVFLAVAKTFREHGLRQSRAKTRLFHLIEAVGMDKVRAYIVSYSDFVLESAGRTIHQKDVPETFTPLRDGTYGCCVQSVYGKMEREQLEAVAKFAIEEALSIRFGVDQNLYLVGLKQPDIPFSPVPAVSQVTACAGSRYCALSLWNIKDDTAYLPLDLIEKHHIQVGFSGCLKGCGRHHHCDIGLVGLRTNLFGDTQKAARVYLGGEYSSGGAPARLIFPSVPLTHLKELIETVIESFEASRKKDFEAFCAAYLNGHSSAFVLLWYLSQCYLKRPPKLEKASEAALYERLKACEDFPDVAESESYAEAIKVMMHALWDD